MIPTTAKLTTKQIGIARNLVNINGLTIDSAVALTKRRATRKSARPTYIGSVAKAQPYAIV